MSGKKKNQEWKETKTQKGETKYMIDYLDNKISYGITEFKTGKKKIWLIINKELIKNHKIQIDEDNEKTKKRILNYVKVNYINKLNNNLCELLDKKKENIIEINKFGDGYDFT